MSIRFSGFFRSSICLSVVGFIILAGLAGMINSSQRKNISEFTRYKTLRYSFSVTNDSGEVIDSAQIKIFAPVKQNSYQRTLSLGSNRDFELVAEESGNQALMFAIEKLPPFSTEIISITAEIALSENAQEFQAAGDYIAPERNIESDSPEIKSLAENLAGQKDFIADTVSWVYRNVDDVGYIAEDRGAYFAVTEKKGDCTEFSSAVVAISRAQEVPARLIGGFVLEESGRLRADDYHNWAELKRGDSWIIADAQNDILDSGYGSYIAFFNFDRNSRLKNSHRFMSYDSRLTVQML
ncbi:hypothetical protein Maes01_01901 [Microbulbifer aestuariivivens]|uniref:Transglutaminase-like domain-containing protein n=1 Tax=Microbulbifer aestuariivivens TaxID=1908308 RepID=A0ABP9WQ65_9GAMM